MLDPFEEPPTRKRLKQFFLDAHRGQRPPDVLNCVAHMILAIDEPDELASIALEFLVEKLGVCRADLGFAGPADPRYAPLKVQYSRLSDPPRCDDAVYRNRSAVFSQTWRQFRPVACDDVATHPLLSDSRDEFRSIESKSILFQRLACARRPVGMMCLDFTRDAHVWTDAEKDFIGEFSATFLGPLAGISHRWHSGSEAGCPASGAARRPSAAELAAIRLAARGLSCDEIGGALGKSPRTIENQLRSARIALDAANRTELISKCELWL